MLTTRKQEKKPTLIDVKSLQEAIVVLNARKAPTIYTAAISNIFKADMENPASKTWIEQQLRETEHTLNKDEEDKEAYEKKMKEMKETEGNPPTTGEPTPESIANKTGVDGQNDGSSLEDIKDKNPAANAPAGVHAQPGGSQLSEAIDKVTKTGNEKDPLNEAIITAMDAGMTRTEAENAAKADTGMMEAVFNKMASQLLVPIFKAQSAEVSSLKETIVAYDQKLEAARKENKGLNEAIQIIPGKEQPSNQPTTPGQPSSENTFRDKSQEITESMKDNLYQ